MSPPLSPVTSPLTHALDPRDVDAIAERMRARLVAARTVRAFSRRAADLRRRRFDVERVAVERDARRRLSQGIRAFASNVCDGRAFVVAARLALVWARFRDPELGPFATWRRAIVAASETKTFAAHAIRAWRDATRDARDERRERRDTWRADRFRDARALLARLVAWRVVVRSSAGARRDASLRGDAPRVSRARRAQKNRSRANRRQGIEPTRKRDGEPVHARRSRVARVARSRHRRASGGENATTRVRAIRDDGDDGVARGGVEEYSGRTPGGNSRGGARGETRRATRVARVVAEGNGVCEGRVEGRVEGEGREAPGRKRRIVGFGTISSSFSSSSEGSVPVRGPDADESIARGGEGTSPVDVERFDGGADGCERADGRVTFSTGGSAARRADGAGGRGRASRRRVGTLGDAAGTRGAGHRGETRVDSEERRVRARVGGGGDAVGDGRRSGIGSTNRIPRRRIHHSTRRRGIVPLSGNRRPRAWNLCGR